MNPSEKHLHLDDRGNGWCSAPKQTHGMPNGFCDHPAYGEQTTEGTLNYKGHVPGLACAKHGGPTIEEAYESAITEVRASAFDKTGFRLEMKTDGTEFAGDRGRYGAAVRQIMRKVHADLWAGKLRSVIKNAAGDVIGAWSYD